ncbi:MAG: DUF1801 domain-containing protein [Xanthomonadales bacterium]|nr:DUF1801 domain-containing protein [Xanthomonadales bacterium]NIX12393.1 DUF1801 domain-containing protein [Xanthomonadales bacterium]
MSAPKNTQNESDVGIFLASITDDQKREDALELAQMMSEVTGSEPAMWGKNMVGFGSYHYVYASGREGNWFITGFSPRKQNLTIYIMPGFLAYTDLMDGLGKHSTGKSCLYVKRLEDIDRAALRKLVKKSVEDMRSRHECS